MTEDLLEEQSEILAKLGTSAEGTHLRARMQSACLLSDMESFKVSRDHVSLDTFKRLRFPLTKQVMMVLGCIIRDF